MLLFEAAEKLKKRSFPSDYEQFAKYCRTPDKEATELLAQADADIMAIRCMEAQKRLQELLNDLMRTNLDNDTYSANLVVDLLSSIRFDAKFDEDGVFDKEATYAADRGADKPV